MCAGASRIAKGFWGVADCPRPITRPAEFPPSSASVSRALPVLDLSFLYRSEIRRITLHAKR